MRVYEAPQYIPATLGEGRSVFLAGSIEMGAAEEWQERVIKILEKRNPSCIVFNPRRKNWDASWEQSINNPQFNEQVTWEMDQLKRAEVIFFYFGKDTKSPISLLELGLMAHHAVPRHKFGHTLLEKRILVYCPEGFWRKGNIEMVCDRFNIKLYTNFDQAMTGLEHAIDGRTD